MKTKQNLLLKMLFVISFIQFSCSPETEADVELISESFAYEFNEEEMIMLSKINDYRAEMNKNALTMSNYISHVCLDHNLFMIENNIVSHHNFHHRSQLIKNTLEVTYVAENIAYNYATVNAAINAWLQSESHKQNLEGDFFYVGISIRKHPENQRIYYTCILAK